MEEGSNSFSDKKEIKNSSQKIDTSHVSEVLRILGGGAARDVWDILAQAADEIEGIYENRMQNMGQTNVSGNNTYTISLPRCQNTFCNSSYRGDKNRNMTSPRQVDVKTCTRRNLSFSSPQSTKKQSDRTYVAGPGKGIESSIYAKNQTWDSKNGEFSRLLGTPNKTYNINETPSGNRCPLKPNVNQTYDIPANKTFSNGTFILNEPEPADCSFCPNPALASSPIRGPQTPAFRNFTDPSLEYSFLSTGNQSSLRSLNSSRTDAARNPRFVNNTYNIPKWTTCPKKNQP